jgi:polysaccharide export outer membrane protein
LNEITAVGLTPGQLRTVIEEQAKKFVQNPNVTVVVKQINSRRVFITGNVARPGSYNLTGQTTVLQLIAMAGGLLEYADRKSIVIERTEKGQQLALKFNYNDIIGGKNLQSNVVLKPGDTVVVP